jgi:hypothetical protein
MIRAKRMGWDGHVAPMWEKKNAYGLLTGRLKGKRTILKWILNKSVERA